MAELGDYTPVYSELAANAIVALPRRKAQRVLDLCRILARNPFVGSDYVVTDSSGHTVEHLLTEGFILTYWVDHAAKTVMVVEVDSAE